jgi:hypothetical protein
MWQPGNRAVKGETDSIIIIIIIILLLLRVIFGTQIMVTHVTRIRNMLSSSADQGESSEGNTS